LAAEAVLAWYNDQEISAYAIASDGLLCGLLNYGQFLVRIAARPEEGNGQRVYNHPTSRDADEREHDNDTIC